MKFPFFNCNITKRYNLPIFTHLLYTIKKSILYNYFTYIYIPDEGIKVF